MSTFSYTTADELKRRWRKWIETSEKTAGDLEWHINDAEAEINGILAKRYTVPFSYSLFPVEPVRTVTRLFAGHSMLRSMIIQEDPSKSDWVESIRAQGQTILDKIEEGKLDLIACADNVVSAVVIPRRKPATEKIWSSTMTYVPSLDHRDATVQQVDPDRLDDEDDRADA